MSEDEIGVGESDKEPEREEWGYDELDPGPESSSAHDGGEQWSLGNNEEPQEAETGEEARPSSPKLGESTPKVTDRNRSRRRKRSRNKSVLSDHSIRVLIWGHANYGKSAYLWALGQRLPEIQEGPFRFGPRRPQFSKYWDTLNGSATDTSTQGWENTKFDLEKDGFLSGDMELFKVELGEPRPGIPKRPKSAILRHMDMAGEGIRLADLYESADDFDDPGAEKARMLDVVLDQVTDAHALIVIINASRLLDDQERNKLASFLANSVKWLQQNSPGKPIAFALTAIDTITNPEFDLLPARRALELDDPTRTFTWGELREWRDDALDYMERVAKTLPPAELKPDPKGRSPRWSGFDTDSATWRKQRTRIAAQLHGDTTLAGAILREVATYKRAELIAERYREDLLNPNDPSARSRAARRLVLEHLPQLNQLDEFSSSKADTLFYPVSAWGHVPTARKDTNWGPQIPIPEGAGWTYPDPQHVEDPVLWLVENSWKVLASQIKERARARRDRALLILSLVLLAFSFLTNGVLSSEITTPKFRGDSIADAWQGWLPTELVTDGHEPTKRALYEQFTRHRLQASLETGRTEEQKAESWKRSVDALDRLRRYDPKGFWASRAELKNWKDVNKKSFITELSPVSGEPFVQPSRTETIINQATTEKKLNEIDTYLTKSREFRSEVDEYSWNEIHASTLRLLADNVVRTPNDRATARILDEFRTNPKLALTHGEPLARILQQKWIEALANLEISQDQLVNGLLQLTNAVPVAQQADLDKIAADQLAQLGIAQILAGEDSLLRQMDEARLKATRPGWLTPTVTGIQAELDNLIGARGAEAVASISKLKKFPWFVQGAPRTWGALLERSIEARDAMTLEDLRKSAPQTSTIRALSSNLTRAPLTSLDADYITSVGYASLAADLSALALRHAQDYETALSRLDSPEARAAGLQRWLFVVGSADPTSLSGSTFGPAAALLSSLATETLIALLFDQPDLVGHVEDLLEISLVPSARADSCERLTTALDEFYVKTVKPSPAGTIILSELSQACETSSPGVLPQLAGVAVTKILNTPLPEGAPVAQRIARLAALCNARDTDDLPSQVQARVEMTTLRLAEEIARDVQAGGADERPATLNEPLGIWWAGSDTAPDELHWSLSSLLRETLVENIPLSINRGSGSSQALRNLAGLARLTQTDLGPKLFEEFQRQEDEGGAVQSDGIAVLKKLTGLLAAAQASAGSNSPGVEQVTSALRSCLQFLLDGDKGQDRMQLIAATDDFRRALPADFDLRERLGARTTKALGQLYLDRLTDQFCDAESSEVAELTRAVSEIDASTLDRLALQLEPRLTRPEDCHIKALEASALLQASTAVGSRPAVGALVTVALEASQRLTTGPASKKASEDASAALERWNRAATAIAVTGRTDEVRQAIAQLWAVGLQTDDFREGTAVLISVRDLERAWPALRLGALDLPSRFDQFLQRVYESRPGAQQDQFTRLAITFLQEQLLTDLAGCPLTLDTVQVAMARMLLLSSPQLAIDSLPSLLGMPIREAVSRSEAVSELGPSVLMPEARRVAREGRPAEVSRLFNLARGLNDAASQELQSLPSLIDEARSIVVAEYKEDVASNTGRLSLSTARTHSLLEQIDASAGTASRAVETLQTALTELVRENKLNAPSRDDLLAAMMEQLRQADTEVTAQVTLGAMESLLSTTPDLLAEQALSGLRYSLRTRQTREIPEGIGAPARAASSVAFFLGSTGAWQQGEELMRLNGSGSLAPSEVLLGRLEDGAIEFLSSFNPEEALQRAESWKLSTGLKEKHAYVHAANAFRNGESDLAEQAAPFVPDTEQGRRLRAAIASSRDLVYVAASPRSDAFYMQPGEASCRDYSEFVSRIQGTQDSNLKSRLLEVARQTAGSNSLTWQQLESILAAPLKNPEFKNFLGSSRDAPATALDFTAAACFLAANGLSVPTDEEYRAAWGQGAWPWGDDWDEARAQTLEACTGRPKPVPRAFANGPAFSGLFGNVREWCRLSKTGRIGTFGLDATEVGRNINRTQWDELVRPPDDRSEAPKAQPYTGVRGVLRTDVEGLVAPPRPLEASPAREQTPGPAPAATVEEQQAASTPPSRPELPPPSPASSTSPQIIAAIRELREGRPLKCIEVAENAPDSPRRRRLIKAGEAAAQMHYFPKDGAAPAFYAATVEVRLADYMQFLEGDLQDAQRGDLEAASSLEAGLAEIQKAPGCASFGLTDVRLITNATPAERKRAVHNVTWPEAQLYAASRGCSLLTIQQFRRVWGSATYPWGDEWSDYMSRTADGSGQSGLALLPRLKAPPRNVLGNVREWGALTEDRTIPILGRDFTQNGKMVRVDDAVEETRSSRAREYVGFRLAVTPSSL